MCVGIPSSTAVLKKGSDKGKEGLSFICMDITCMFLRRKPNDLFAFMKCYLYELSTEDLKLFI